MAFHPIPLPCALAFPPPSHRDATTPSPCWAPHFMTRERIMFSNLTPSKPHLFPAATMSYDTLSALTPPLHCASILQPATPPQVVAFDPETISAPICLNCFTFAESRKSDLWTCMCVSTFFYPAFTFLIETNFSFQSLFAIWSLSPQRFHYYFYLSVVSWQYQKYSNILILVLSRWLLFVTPLILPKLCPVFTFLQQLMTKKCELFTHTLVLQCSPSTSSRQPQTTWGC